MDSTEESSVKDRSIEINQPKEQRGKTKAKEVECTQCYTHKNSVKHCVWKTNELKTKAPESERE